MDIEMISYCGLCCLDCIGHKNIIADITRDLRKELRTFKFKRLADFAASESFSKVYKDYDKCYDVLGVMVKFHFHKGCKAGGRNPFCKTRKCCYKGGFEGC